MVTGSLTDKMQQSGETLTRLLDEAKLPPRAALWLYDSELNAWRLVFGFDCLDETGSRPIYARIQSLLARNRDRAPGIELMDISVVPSKTGLVAALRTVVRTRPGISGIRFSRNAVNGHYVEDAFIYRLT